jgi:hypothetical protein
MTNSRRALRYIGSLVIVSAGTLVASSCSIRPAQPGYGRLAEAHYSDDGDGEERDEEHDEDAPRRPRKRTLHERATVLFRVEKLLGR